MTESEENKVRIEELKKAIKAVGISQNKLLQRFAADKFDHDQEVKNEVERLKKALSPKRRNIPEAELNALFDCLSIIVNEKKLDYVVSSSIKGAIVNDNLSSIISGLSKKLDKKLAATEGQ